MCTTSRQFIDLTQALSSHKRHIYGDIQRHQALVRADVAGRLLSTDVLLTCLKCKHETTSALRILGLAYDSARHLTDIILVASHETHIRAAIAKRNAERLTVTDGNIESPFTRSLYHGQC